MRIRRRTINSYAEIPAGVQPRREVTRRGYVELLWRVSENEYVRCWEHRYVAGFPRGHVHHINEDKGDNRPENLQNIAPGAHFKHHGCPGHNRIDIDESAVRSMFEAGYGCPTIAKALGVSTMPVQRVLRTLGLRRPPGSVKGMPKPRPATQQAREWMNGETE